MELYTIAIVVHIIGAVIGVGTVTVYDLQYLRAIGDRSLAEGFLKSSRFYSRLIQAGLTLLIISGVYFIWQKPVFLSSEKILTKLSLVGILIINGIIINSILQPKLEALSPDEWENKSSDFKKAAKFKIPFDVISIVSWYSILILGAVGRQPWQAWQIAAVYILILVVTYIVARSVVSKRLSNR